MIDAEQDCTGNLHHTRALASDGKSGGSSYRTIKDVIWRSEVSGKALDYGAGTGHMAEWMVAQKQFSSVVAADIAEYTGRADRQDLNWMQADLNHSIPIDDSSFDFVVSAEVIEHLENPRFVAREWYRLLRPGGSLVMSTPNNESWRALAALVARGHFVYFGETSYPAHITALLRKDIERILKEAGFDLLSFVYTDHGDIPGKPSITWQEVSGGRLKGRRFSDNIICFARKPPS